MRFYNPDMGRWLNRDPVGEAGGNGLYLFVFNSCPNAYDSDGRLTSAAVRARLTSIGTRPAGSRVFWLTGFERLNNHYVASILPRIRRFADGSPANFSPSRNRLRLPTGYGDGDLYHELAHALMYYDRGISGTGTLRTNEGVAYQVENFLSVAELLTKVEDDLISSSSPNIGLSRVRWQQAWRMAHDGVVGELGYSLVYRPSFTTNLADTGNVDRYLRVRPRCHAVALRFNTICRRRGLCAEFSCSHLPLPTTGALIGVTVPLNRLLTD